MNKDEMLEESLFGWLNREPAGLRSAIKKHDWYMVEATLELMAEAVRKFIGIDLIFEEKRGLLIKRIWKIEEEGEKK